MRGKRGIIIGIMLCMIGLTACSSESKYSEEETTIIADYVAQTVLKHSEGYEQKLVDLSDSPFELTEEEDYVDSLNNDELKEVNSENDSIVVDKNEALAKDEDKETKDTSSIEDVKDISKVELSDVLGFQDGIEAYVSKHKEFKEYASGSYVIDVEGDEKLVEVIINIKNTTNKTEKIVTPTSGITYKLVASNEEYYPLLSAIENDLVYFNKSIKPGKTEEAILIYKVPKDVDSSSLAFVVENNGEEVEAFLNK